MRHRVLTVILGALFAVACRQPDAIDHFRTAQTYARQSRIEEAILEYRAGLQIDPRRADARRKLAELYLQHHETANALKEYVRAADLLPNDSVAQTDAGNMLLLAGQFEDAKARANKVLALDPKNAAGQILLGNALAGLKDVDGALKEYGEALALNPNQEGVYLDIGTIQLARGQRNEAEASFRKAIAVAPQSVGPRLALANFLWAAGRSAEGEQSLKDALKIEPTNFAVNRALGTFYLGTNRAAEAEPYFKAVAESAKTTEATLTLAGYYAVTNQFDKARKALKTLADTPQGYVVATTRLAALDAAEGRPVEAQSKIQAVLSKAPKDTAARLLNARLLEAAGRHDEALAEADTVITDEPNSLAATQALLLTGSIQAASNRVEDAIRTYEEILKQQTQTLPAALALAALYLRTGAMDKAEAFTQQALTIDPKNPAGRTLLIRLLLAKKNLPTARAQLATLEKDLPDSPAVLDLIAAEQLANGQTEAARASYTKAWQLAPMDLEALAGVVTIDLNARRMNDAVAHVEEGLKRAQPTAMLLLLAARTHAAAGNLARSEELLKRAIEAQPSNLQAYELLGRLYMGQKRLPEAIDQFRSMLGQDPRSVAANTMLALLLEADGRIPEAEQQYEKVLALDPKAAAAANNLAWLYVAGNRNLDRALELAQTAKQRLADDPHVDDTLGWVYYRKDMATRAIPYLKASVDRDSTDPTTHYHLGMAYYLGGDLGKAREELNRALAFNAPFDGADEARRTLQALQAVGS